MLGIKSEHNPITGEYAKKLDELIKEKKMKKLFEGQDIILDYDENNKSYRISLFFQGHWHGEMFYCPETGILEDDEGHVLKDGDGFKYHEEIDEVYLDNLYKEYRLTKDSPFTIEEDFKAGYRKAMEN